MRTWVFDLDNTLHDASPHIFPHINRSMTEYLQRHLGLDEEAAGDLRRHYWKRYGATLLGLMKHHATNPHDFLHETHQFPDLPRMVCREPALRAMLKRLPGRKIVFSNAPAHYMRAVLKVLRIGDLFDGAFAIEHTGFRPKPDPGGFLRLFRAHRMHARSCIMVEDVLENLKTAKKLGMRTVWVGTAPKAPPYVDVIVKSVLELPRLLRRLG